MKYDYSELELKKELSNRIDSIDTTAKNLKEDISSIKQDIHQLRKELDDKVFDIENSLFKHIKNSELAWKRREEKTLFYTKIAGVFLLGLLIGHLFN